jgi:hypothetical protein
VSIGLVSAAMFGTAAERAARVKRSVLKGVESIQGSTGLLQRNQIMRSRDFNGEIDKVWQVGFVKKMAHISCLILNA